MDLDFNDKGLIGYLWKMSLQVSILCLKRDMGFSEGACTVQRHLKSAVPTSATAVLASSKGFDCDSTAALCGCPNLGQHDPNSALCL